MTETQVNAILSDLRTSTGDPSLTIVDMFNNHVHNFCYGSGQQIVNMSCSYDYEKKKPIGRTLWCESFQDDIIKLVAAEDTCQLRWYIDQYYDMTQVTSLDMYSPFMNPYMKMKITLAKIERNSGSSLVPKKPTEFSAVAAEKNYPPENT